MKLLSTLDLDNLSFWRFATFASAAFAWLTVENLKEDEE